MLRMLVAGLTVAAAFLLKMLSADTVCFRAAKTKEPVALGINDMTDYSMGQMLSRASFWLLLIFFTLLTSISSAP